VILQAIAQSWIPRPDGRCPRPGPGVERVFDAARAGTSSEVRQEREDSEQIAGFWAEWVALSHRVVEDGWPDRLVRVEGSY